MHEDPIVCKGALELSLPAPSVSLHGTQVHFTYVIEPEKVLSYLYATVTSVTVGKRSEVCPREVCSLKVYQDPIHTGSTVL